MSSHLSAAKVALPPHYKSLWDKMQGLQIKWLDISAPEACYGDFETRLLVEGFGPLGIVVIGLVVFIAWEIFKHARHNCDLRSGVRAVVKASFFRALPAMLKLSFLLVPTVSKKIFSSFDCNSYDFDSVTGEVKEFLREDSAVVCYDSTAHTHIVAFAAVLIFLWPIGMPASYALLVTRARGAIMERRPSTLSEACSFLHAEYKPEYFYWEALDLTRRIVLTGALLMVRDKYITLRLIAALLMSLVWLTLLFSTYPYSSRRGIQTLYS